MAKADFASQYVGKLRRDLARGDASEGTHYRALGSFLEAMRAGVTATLLPKGVSCGTPDFRVRLGKLGVGYVEAKDVGASLDKVEKTEQLKRYRTLPNLVLTNYIEFRHYVDGELRRRAHLASLSGKDKITVLRGGPQDVRELVADFLDRPPEDIARARPLAQRLARYGHEIREVVVAAFREEETSRLLLDLREAFEQVLIPELSDEQFADMFAQTLAYGLFAARIAHPRGKAFSREHAAVEIPKTNPFLRQLFSTITGPDLDDEPYAPYVDDVVQLLAHADIGEILKDFGRAATQRQDPVVHFYETFLAEYDRRLRKVRGVYYTPDPVVSYIVRSVHYLLKERFRLRGGLADRAQVTVDLGEGKSETMPRVLILDPACGTGTFLYQVIALVRERFVRSKNVGMWSEFVRQHLLPRLYGFELLMAPYTVAHMKLALELAGRDLAPAQRNRLAYDFRANERLNIFLTNTLEQTERRIEGLYGPMRIISDEANAARGVKRDLPIMVVLGNPPYAGHSANKSEYVQQIEPGAEYLVRVGSGRRATQRRRKAGPRGARVKRKTFIGRLLEDYYFVDGQPLKERNPKWLQDDYVKFIRFGQWRIDRTGSGVLAFITNHGYLDNPTFRGMRQSLMQTFDEIYVLDLHGSSKKKEVCPDGSKDENVFDIRQGVAILILVKTGAGGTGAGIFHADLWGLRETKYASLAGSALSSTAWAELQPGKPFYLFRPQDAALFTEYDAGKPIPELFATNSVGIVTARDELTVHWSKDEAWETVNDFVALSDAEARTKYDLGPDARDWKVTLAQEDVRTSGPRREHLQPILYRPFDVRWTYYTGQTRGFHCMPRAEVMRHMIPAGNLALVSARSNKSQVADHFLCSAHIMETKCGESTTQSALFPLYLLPLSDEAPGHQRKAFDSPWPPGPGGRTPNLSPVFVDEFAGKLGLEFVSDGLGDLAKTFGPEDIFNYAYALFHSPTYRERYAEFLKIDFPRLPLTGDRDLFARLVSLGGELVALHLMQSPALEEYVTTYPVPGSNEVAKGFPRYVPPGERAPDPEDETGTRLVPSRGRVYVNAGAPANGAKKGGRGKVPSRGQFFDGVPPEVWGFHVGGYQVCEKWLKDRRGRALADADLHHYRRIVVALSETMRLMQEIDRAIPSWPIT